MSGGGELEEPTGEGKQSRSRSMWVSENEKKKQIGDNQKRGARCRPPRYPIEAIEHHRHTRSLFYLTSLSSTATLGLRLAKPRAKKD